MKKLIILLLLTFLLAGCTSKYNLEISNNSFKEDINAVIKKDEIPKDSKYSDIELDDQITPFLKNEYPALFSKPDALYKKKVTYFDDYINVDMNYKYTAEEFENSNSLRLCFEDYEYLYDDTYYIHASGTFYCLYTDEMDINIKTHNKVIDHNADSVNGNVYTWHINGSNVNDVNILFEVKKGIELQKIVSYLIIGIILAVLVAVSCILLRKNSKKVNKV